MKQSFLQKLINVGTVLLHASDQTTAMLELINIKKPTDIKRYLSRLIETVRDEKKTSQVKRCLVQQQFILAIKLA